MKKLTIILICLMARVSCGAYYNLLTGQHADTLPTSMVYGEKVYSGLKSLPLELCAKVGWREVRNPPVASAGSQIVSVTYRQDDLNPLRVVAVVVEKTDEEIQREQDAAQAAADSEIKADRDALTEPFKANEKQAEAIGKLFDLLRR